MPPLHSAVACRALPCRQQIGQAVMLVSNWQAQGAAHPPCSHSVHAGAEEVAAVMLGTTQ